MASHGSALLMESWGLYGHSPVSTPVGVLGAVWPVTGQHFCGSPGGCMASHGSALLGEFWGLYGQSRVSTPRGVLGAVWAITGQHSCGSPGAV